MPRDCTPRALPRASRSGRHVGLRPPRNDKSGSRCHFNGGPFESAALRRERHAAPLQWPVQFGSAFPRLPRRFAPRNDNSGAFAISTMVHSFRRCSAGHGCPLPRNYNTWSAASRSFPLSIFSLPHVPFLKNQFQTRCVLGGAQRVFSGKMTVLRRFSV